MADSWTNEPRMPKGSPDGGEWTSGGGSARHPRRGEEGYRYIRPIRKKVVTEVEGRKYDSTKLTGYALFEQQGDKVKRMGIARTEEEERKFLRLPPKTEAQLAADAEFQRRIRDMSDSHIRKAKGR